MHHFIRCEHIDGWKGSRTRCLSLAHLKREASLLATTSASAATMSDSFFQKKRKRPSDSGGSAKAGPSRPRMREKSGAGSSGGGSGGGKSKRGGRPAAALDDEDLGSGTAELGDGDDGDSDDGGIEGMDLAHRYDEDVLSSDEDKAETPAEARVRLARMYLDSLKDEDVDPEDADAAEIDRQNISSRLQADAATHSSHVHTFVADRLRRPSTTSTEHILACRGHHRMPLTSVVVSADRASFWTAAKDGKIIRWRLYDGKMLEVISKARRTCQTHANGAEPAPARRGKHSGVRRSSSSGAARRRARAHAATKATHNDDRKANGSTSTAGRNGDSGDVPSLQYVALGDNEGHRDEVWALAVSSDGRHLVSGGKDRRICVWAIGNPAISFISNGKTDKHDAEAAGTSFVRALGGHKDSITALRFRQGSHDLFTASADRTLKLFDVSQLSYVETFFGHQEEVAGMDVLRGEVVVTAGSRDRTLRWWKVRDESQLVFRGGAKSKVRDVLEGGDIALDEDGVDHPIRENGPTQNYVEGSIDAVAMVDEHSFLSGGDSGTISLWSLAKKKPIFTVPVAHGCDEVDNGEHKIRTPRWITSLTCLPYGDVFASGECSG